MSGKPEPKIDGRTIEEFLRDPNHRGAFVGGPPLLTRANAPRLIEDPEGVERDARAALKKIWEEKEPDSPENDYDKPPYI